MAEAGEEQQNGVTSGPAMEYDLLPRLIPHLDRHLVYPILEFLEQQENQDLLEIKKLKFELLKETNMTDFVSALDQEIRGVDEAADEWAKKREVVMQRREELENQTQRLLEMMDNPDVTGALRADRTANMNYLKEQHNVTLEEVNALYEHGQFLYGIGDYGGAAEMLFQFRIISPESDRTSHDRLSHGYWGTLACEILQANWESAMKEIDRVKETIESRFFNAPLSQLQHRTWLLHWALFPLYHFDAARDPLIELFFTPAFINTIQTSCPWILRYLAVAVIAARNTASASTATGNKHLSGGGSAYQKQLKDLVRVVRQEAYEYRDPVTEFLRALYVDFDFEEAQRQLTAAAPLLRTDFFLHTSADAFIDAARHLISESYCKIHQRIDIKDLSTRLGLTQDEGEKWIVNLIRDTRVDAKIDYKAGTVVMNHPPQSVYQQVIERTKGGFFRTQVLSAAVAK